MLNNHNLIFLIFVILSPFLFSCEDTFEDDIDYVVPGSARFKDIITDRDGNPLEGAEIVVWAGDVKYKDLTDENGEYNILVPINQFPNSGEIAISVYKNGFRPYPGTYQAPLSDRTIYEIAHPMSECPNCLRITNGYKGGLIHLGDNNFNGAINSQFQKDSDSEHGVLFRFNGVPSSRLRVTFFAKGVQCRDNAVILGNTVQKLSASPSNGDYELYSLTFNNYSNAREIGVVTSSCSPNDKDDWEFVAFHVEAL